MAKYTISGVVYDEKGYMATVDVVTSCYAEYDNWRQALQLQPAYRLVCTLQNGANMTQTELVKGA